MTAADKYEAFKKQYKETKQKLVDESSAAFKEMTSDIFEKFQGLNSFGWTQYTPYFNDGDTCEFGVHAYSDSIYVNDSRDGYGEDRNEACTLSTEDRKSIGNGVSDMLRVFEDFILEDIYGDHCKVTIFRDGKAQVDEYDHD